MLLIELKKLGKVEKLTLGCLWSKITWGITAWTNSSLEHKVECYRGRRFNAGIGVLELILLDQLTKLLAAEVINLQKLA